MPVFWRFYRYFLRSTGNFETHGPGPGHRSGIPVFALPTDTSAMLVNTGKMAKLPVLWRKLPVYSLQKYRYFRLNTGNFWGVLRKYR